MSADVSGQILAARASVRGSWLVIVALFLDLVEIRALCFLMLGLIVAEDSTPTTLEELGR